MALLTSTDFTTYIRAHYLAHLVLRLVTFMTLMLLCTTHVTDIITFSTKQVLVGENVLVEFC